MSAGEATGMYALTIWQPWAGAIARGTKRVENRDWPAPSWVIGQTVAIHAGRRFDRAARPPLGTSWALPGSAFARGAVVAVARVSGCHWYRQCSTDLGCLCSLWAAWGQYHWQLSAVCALPEPVPARGYQKLWRVPSALAERIGTFVADSPQQARRLS